MIKNYLCKGLAYVGLDICGEEMAHQISGLQQDVTQIE